VSAAGEEKRDFAGDCGDVAIVVGVSNPNLPTIDCQILPEMGSLK